MCHQKIVTNDDLAKLMDTSDEWINKEVELKNAVTLMMMTPTDIAEKAALAALERRV